MSEATNKYPWQSKFSLAEDTPLHGNFGEFGVINFTQVSLEGAEQLHAAGFPYLIKNEVKPNKKASTGE